MKNRIFQGSIKLNATKAADGYIPICDVIMGSVRAVLLNPSVPAPNSVVVGPVGSTPDGKLEVVARILAATGSGIAAAQFPAYIALRCAYGFSGVDPVTSPVPALVDLAMFHSAVAAKPDLYEAETVVLRGQTDDTTGAGSATRFVFTPGGCVARLGFLVALPGAGALGSMALDVEVWAVS